MVKIECDEIQGHRVKKWERSGMLNPSKSCDSNGSRKNSRSESQGVCEHKGAHFKTRPKIFDGRYRR